mmetsp:Transcript_53234/g.105778  ORF Transcript_53234/g.105778 Transcript_53234/m.105778 type:complete len:202 (-) Transcript_53234:924-1529(-)
MPAVHPSLAACLPPQPRLCWLRLQLQLVDGIGFRQRPQHATLARRPHEAAKAAASHGLVPLQPFQSLPHRKQSSLAQGVPRPLILRRLAAPGACGRAARHAPPLPDEGPTPLVLGASQRMKGLQPRQHRPSPGASLCRPIAQLLGALDAGQHVPASSKAARHNRRHLSHQGRTRQPPPQLALTCPHLVPHSSFEAVKAQQT